MIMIINYNNNSDNNHDADDNDDDGNEVNENNYWGLHNFPVLVSESLNPNPQFKYFFHKRIPKSVVPTQALLQQTHHKIRAVIITYHSCCQHIRKLLHCYGIFGRLEGCSCDSGHNPENKTYCRECHWIMNNFTQSMNTRKGHLLTRCVFFLAILVKAINKNADCQFFLAVKTRLSSRIIE